MAPSPFSSPSLSLYHVLSLILKHLHFTPSVSFLPLLFSFPTFLSSTPSRNLLPLNPYYTPLSVLFFSLTFPSFRFFPPILSAQVLSFTSSPHTTTSQHLYLLHFSSFVPRSVATPILFLRTFLAISPTSFFNLSRAQNEIFPRTFLHSPSLTSLLHLFLLFIASLHPCARLYSLISPHPTSLTRLIHLLLLSIAFLHLTQNGIPAHLPSLISPHPPSSPRPCSASLSASHFFPIPNTEWYPLASPHPLFSPHPRPSSIPAPHFFPLLHAQNGIPASPLILLSPLTRALHPFLLLLIPARRPSSSPRPPLTFPSRRRAQALRKKNMIGILRSIY